MYKDPDRIKAMLANKVQGYVLKNKSHKQLIEAINRLYRGDIYFPEEIRTEHFESFIIKDLSDESIKKIALSPREKEVLRLISQGLQAKEVADQLNIELNTVQTHKNNLMRKTGSRNVQDLTRYGVLNGYYAIE
jgi:DNA-binding NarL/FixJ family response regulator